MRTSFPSLRPYLLWLALLSTSPLLQGQADAQLPFLPDQLAAQWQQPAYLAGLASHSIQLGAYGGYGAGSRHLSLSRIYGSSGYLDTETKEAILSELQPDNLFRIDARAGGMVALRGAGLPLSVSYRRASVNTLRFAQPHTLGLVLFGNARYAGENLSDEDVALFRMTYDEIGLGTAFGGETWQVGFRLKGLLSTQAEQLDLSYSLFTEAEGAYLDLGLTYDYVRQTRRGGGFGLDLGATYQLGPQWTLQLAALDLGALRISGDRFQLEESLSYEGVALTDVLAGDWQNPGNLFAVDSLQDLVLASAEADGRWLALPGQVQLGAAFAATERDRVLAQVAWGLQPTSDARPAPRVSLGYQRQTWDLLSLGVHAYGGGIDDWGWGASLAGTFQTAATVRTSAFVSYQMGRSLGIVQADQLRSLYLSAGLNFALTQAEK
ncbi:MAG: hypothetical protein D6722_15410 [Bacteroidetes bacterium]|nr:MAG: hypothetical protein D6722_15410 [Bacteroidota bacterium]